MRCASTGADSDASPPTGCFPATDGIRQVIPSPPKSSGLPVRRPPNAPASRTNRSILIRYATVLPPIYSKPGPTCGPSRCFWDIATLRKRRFICISPGDISAPRVVRWMHSRFTNKESRHRAYESASFGGGRHRSLSGVQREIASGRRPWILTLQREGWPPGWRIPRLAVQRKANAPICVFWIMIPSTPSSIMSRRRTDENLKVEDCVLLDRSQTLPCPDTRELRLMVVVAHFQPRRLKTFGRRVQFVGDPHPSVWTGFRLRAGQDHVFASQD